MIPRRYIEEWKDIAPWPDNSQVEQDLIISRALVEIFSDPFLKEHLAFRGGTALHKLYLEPSARYSEDIDLVQIKKEPIKPVLEKIREAVKFLGTKRTVKPRANNNTIVYRFESEIPPIINMRLKIEINCREHFNINGIIHVPFEVKNGWFSGKCEIATYTLEELLGTKLRALYQRKKGRDLFDLHLALNKYDKLNIGQIIECYKKYMNLSDNIVPSRKMFLKNMDLKMQDKEFKKDIYTILKPGVLYDNDEAYEFVKTNLLEKI